MRGMLGRRQFDTWVVAEWASKQARRRCGPKVDEHIRRISVVSGKPSFNFAALVSFARGDRKEDNCDRGAQRACGEC